MKKRNTHGNIVCNVKTAGKITYVVQRFNANIECPQMRWQTLASFDSEASARLYQKAALELDYDRKSHCSFWNAEIKINTGFFAGSKYENMGCKLVMRKPETWDNPQVAEFGVVRVDPEHSVAPLIGTLTPNRIDGRWQWTIQVRDTGYGADGKLVIEVKGFNSKSVVTRVHKKIAAYLKNNKITRTRF